MNVRVAFPALIGAVMLAGSAFAATASNPNDGVPMVDRIHQETRLAATDKCMALENQWNSVKTQHKSAANYAQAEKYFNDGVKMCGAGKKEDGIKMLDKALHTIGVNPVS